MRKWHKISILFDDFYICFINENISKYEPLLNENKCTPLQKRTAPNISPFFNKRSKQKTKESGQDRRPKKPRRGTVRPPHPAILHKKHDFQVSWIPFFLRSFLLSFFLPSFFAREEDRKGRWLELGRDKELGGLKILRWSCLQIRRRIARRNKMIGNEVIILWKMFVFHVEPCMYDIFYEILIKIGVSFPCSGRMLWKKKWFGCVKYL